MRLSPNLHVRTGTSRYRKKRGLEQKGVDILLAIEAYQNAVQGNMDIVEILTSDLDFYPVFDALVQTRVKAHLIYDPNKTSKELVYSADNVSAIDCWKYLQWCHEDFNKDYSFKEIPGSNPKPQVSEEIVLIKEGSLCDSKFEVFKDEKNNQYIGYSEAKNHVVSSLSEFIMLGRFEQIFKGEKVIF